MGLGPVSTCAPPGSSNNSRVVGPRYALADPPGRTVRLRSDPKYRYPHLLSVGKADATSVGPREWQEATYRALGVVG